MKKVYCEVSKCLGCRSCEIACAVEHSKSKTLFKAIKEDPLPIHRRKVQAVEQIVISDACHHCETAFCVEACMSGAMYKAENGTTQHNEEKCIGCWMCVMVCPFGAISRQKKLALKCDLCKDRTDGPVCVVSCPTKALKIKEVDRS
jgi:anaerobic carbon-monoxide dehydrogenase iron sulfur subunit